MGARIFRNAELVFRFEKAMRFQDEIQIEILDCMRFPGGKKPTTKQWRALQNTELVSHNDIPPGWYHTCYVWSIISMTSFLVARQSADRASQTLFYVQAARHRVRPFKYCTTTVFYVQNIRAQLG